MKLSMEQFQERLVDYLYGELDGESLREFEACLHESEACRSELAAYQKTLSSARATLAREQAAPPSRVRAAVLAAAAAGAAQARVGAAARVEEKQSVWSFLRLPWLVPSFGVAAAVTLFVLGREIESPEAHHESESSAPMRAEPSAVSSAPAVSEPAVSMPAQPAPLQEPDGLASGRAEEKARARPARSRAESKGYAVPPPAWAGEHAGSATARRAAPSAEFEAAEQPVEQEPRKPADKAVSGEGSARLRSQAGGGGLGGALADHPAPAPAAPAAAAVSAAPARLGEARRDEPSADDAQASPKKSASSPTREALIERARAQTASAQWTEARETYRLLLRRYAGDEQAAVWRRELAALERAEADSGR